MKLPLSIVPVFGVLVLSVSAFGQSCPSPLTKTAMDIQASQLADSKFIGCCAVTNLWAPRVEGWQKSVPSEVAKYTTDIHRTWAFNNEFDQSVSDILINANDAARVKKDFTAGLARKLADPVVQSKISDIAVNKACPSGVDFQTLPEEGFHNHSFTKTMNAQASLAATLKDSQEVSVKGNRVKFCSDPVHMKSSLEDTTSSESVDLKGKSFFANNSPSLSAEQQSAVLAEFDKKLKPSQPGCVKKITHVQINTSSNLVRNGAPYESFKFDKISSDRAVYLRNLASEYLKGHPKNVVAGGALKFDMDAKGSNTSQVNTTGTSGPCPYYTETQPDGKTKVTQITDQATFSAAAASGQLDGDVVKGGVKSFLAEVESAKKGEIVFETEENCPGKVQNESPEEEFYATQCFYIQVSCKR